MRAHIDLRNPEIRAFWKPLILQAWLLMPRDGNGNLPKVDAAAAHMFFHGLNVSRETLKRWRGSARRLDNAPGKS